MLAAVAVATSLLAACGSGQADTTTNPEGLTEITFVRSTGATFEGLYIAQEQGYFAEAGLDVDIVAGSPDTSQHIPMVLNGEADLTMGDPANHLTAISRGIPIRYVTQMQAAVADQTVTDGVLVPPGSPVRSGKDLQGKRVGVPALGGWMEMNVRYAIETDGGDPTDVQLVALPVASLQEAATKGDVDAVTLFPSFYQSALESGFTALHKGTTDFPGLPTSTVIASSEWLARNGEVADAFVTAITRGLEYANENPDAVRAVDAEYTQMDAETIANRVIPRFVPVFDEQAVTDAVNRMSAYGMLENEIDMGAVFWENAPVE
ncbi:ABC transporter substrate-binding protein [Pseudonocardia nematodicida]